MVELLADQPRRLVERIARRRHQRERFLNGHPTRRPAFRAVFRCRRCRLRSSPRSPGAAQVYFGPRVASLAKRCIMTRPHRAFTMSPTSANVRRHVGRECAGADGACHAYVTLSRPRWARWRLIDQQTDAFLETQVVRHAMDKCLDGYVPVPMQSFDYAFHKYKWTCS
jgi:hypothetical protein